MTESRTTGASLFSLASLRIMFSNGHYLPMVRGIDHQMNYVIQQDKIVIFYYFYKFIILFFFNFIYIYNFIFT